MAYELNAEHDPDESEAMVYTRKELSPLIPVVNAEFPKNLNEAYQLVQGQLDASHLDIAAWKLGGTTTTTQKIFDVEKLYFGPIYGREVQHGSGSAPGFKLFEYKVEAEIALRISTKALDCLKDAARIAQVDHTVLFDAWCVAGEMPSSPIIDMATYGVNALVSDRCATGFLVLATPYSLPGLVFPDWSDKNLEIHIDGTSVTKGNVGDLVWKPEICARDFMQLALEQGFTLKPGQWISTGGVTACVQSPVGSEVVLTLNDETVARFTVKD